MNFGENIQALIGQYGKDLTSLTYDSTERIFYLRKKPNHELSNVGLNDLKIGCFYLLRYNYNGNNIFCPVFTLEYKVIKNKNILYCLNLDYLPYMYKVDFFTKMYNFYSGVFEDNENTADASSEKPLGGVTFESVYKLLQSNGNFEYAVTAFDVLKIKEVNRVSTTILHRFVFLNTRMVNSALMKELLVRNTSADLAEKIKSIIEKYDSIKLDFESDTKYFYKKLRAFEKNYKLVENIT